MKCMFCNQDSTTQEVRSINYIFCCNEIQIENSSLRPIIQNSIFEESKFFQKLSKVIYNPESSPT